MNILGLSSSPSSGGAYALILNEAKGNRRLPIIIGTFEAQAIALELEHIKPPRPMTHDLLKNAIKNFDADVEQVFINDLSEGTFYAKIIFNLNGDHIEQDSRPSDAIALAVRFKSPIYVDDSILDDAGILSDDTTAVSSNAFKQSSEEVKEMSEMEKLDDELQTAIETENYEKAARLRDKINKLKG